MAGAFLRKLWPRAAVPSAAVVEALADLERLARARPALAGPAALLRDLLPGLCEEIVLEAPPRFDQAASRLADGVPILRGESLPFDDRTLGRRWQEVCAVVQRHQPSGAAPVAEAVRAGQLSVAEMAAELFVGGATALHSRFDSLGLDAGLTATILRFTLLPYLLTLKDTLAPLLNHGHWEHGYCPACGSWPLLGELRGLEQNRYLRCGLCAADWGFPRLLCPFCGTREHQALGYFHVEGEEGKQRAATCAACRGYVKMAATLDALSLPQLLVLDLATIHLDLIAAHKGYGGPFPSA